MKATPQQKGAQHTLWLTDHQASYICAQQIIQNVTNASSINFHVGILPANR